MGVPLAIILDRIFPQQKPSSYGGYPHGYGNSHFGPGYDGHHPPASAHQKLAQNEVSGQRVQREVEEEPRQGSDGHLAGRIGVTGTIIYKLGNIDMVSNGKSWKIINGIMGH